MSDKIAMFVGSFDPITNGHMDVIKRASKLFDILYVGLFYNKDKQGFFSVNSRKRMLERALEEFPNVRLIAAHDSLAVDMARHLNVSYLVRGLRSSSDFDYEANLDYFNKNLAPEIETVYLLAGHEWQPVSSSRVRELIYFKADISAYVPEAVVKEVEENFEK
ncbi:pantetheine-phosphate adenylyltransferase [Streptococcus dentiloxodontae]